MEPASVAVYDDASTVTRARELTPTVMWDVVLVPGNWQILLEDTADGTRAWWAPDPLLIRHIAGQGGVAERRIRVEGRSRYVADPGPALRFWRDQGCIVVPRDFPVEAHGREHATYVVTYPAAGGKLHHCWAYERPRIGAPPDVDHGARCRMYASWALDLLGTAAPPEHIQVAFRARDQARLDACSNRSSKSSTTLLQIRALQRRMRAMGWLAHEGDTDPRSNVGAVVSADTMAGGVPVELKRWLGTMTPAQRAAVLQATQGANPAVDLQPSIVQIESVPTEPESAPATGGEVIL